MTSQDGERGDRSQTAVAPEAIQPEQMHWSMWLIHLYLRPRQFFQTFAIRSVPVLTMVTSWLFGIARIMDRIESRVLLSSQPSETYAAIRSSWEAYWAFIVIVGAISGALTYAVGGWWYKVRLRWSGAVEPENALLRRVYVYSAQTWVVPMLFYTLWATYEYQSPAAAAQGDDLLGLVIVVAVFWSVYVSYRGVRTVFAVRPLPARIWFGVLPAIVYALAFVGAAAMFLLKSDAPDLADTVRLDRQAFSLEYPGNWEVDLADEEYDPDAYFSIGPVLADAGIQFSFYALLMDSRDCVDETLANLEEAYELERLAELKEWGSSPGFGYRGEMVVDGGSYRFLAFCATDEEPPFEILQIVEASAYEELEPGFDLIRSSLVLKAPPPPGSE